MCKYPTKNDLRCIPVAWRIDWNRCDRPLLICQRLLEYNPTEQPVQQGTICNSSSLQSYTLYAIRCNTIRIQCTGDIARCSKICIQNYMNVMQWRHHMLLLQDIYYPILCLRVPSKSEHFSREYWSFECRFPSTLQTICIWWYNCIK